MTTKSFHKNEVIARKLVNTQFLDPRNLAQNSQILGLAVLTLRATYMNTNIRQVHVCETFQTDVKRNQKSFSPMKTKEQQITNVANKTMA